jgi:hypothetical protein
MSLSDDSAYCKSPYLDGKWDQWNDDYRTVRGLLPEHGGTCTGTDENPAEKHHSGSPNSCIRCRDHSGSPNSCIRCRVLSALKRLEP